VKKTNVAVVGLGNWGNIHALTYFESDRANLICVCDIDKERAHATAKKFNCEYTTDAKEIANNSEIEIVSITTPDHAHFDPVITMLEAGKNVIVEKPLTTNLREAEEITEKAKAMGVKFMTDFQLRWNMPFMLAKQSIESGKIGKPVMAYARQCNKCSIVDQLAWASKSGPEWFLLPHVIDLVHWLINQEAKEVFASGKKGVLLDKGYDIYDVIQAQVIFDDAIVTFETSWILPESWPKGVDLRLDVVGTNGKLESRQDQQGLEIASDKYETPAVLGQLIAYDKQFGFFKEPILHFLDCVQDDTPCAVAIDDGLAVTRIISAIVESIENHQIVTI